MKKIVSAVLLLWGIGIHAVESTVPQEKMKMSRGDVKIIEATENIRYLSQKIAKEYLFFYTYPENRRIKEELYTTLKDLSSNLQTISAVTKDADTNNLLEFLAYSKEEILNILKKEPTNEQAILMLDYSETLLEGADSIGRTYAYSFSKEEEMLVASKNVSYLLERIMKYYMALYHGYNTQNNRLNLYRSVTKLRDYLVKLNDYVYPEKIEKTRQKINFVWQRDRRILDKLDQYFIPILLSDSVVFLEKKIDILARYHSQNL
jgi:hypothetical protein